MRAGWGKGRGGCWGEEGTAGEKRALLGRRPGSSGTGKAIGGRRTLGHELEEAAKSHQCVYAAASVTVGEEVAVDDGARHVWEHALRQQPQNRAERRPVQRHPKQRAPRLAILRAMHAAREESLGVGGPVSGRAAVRALCRRLLPLARRPLARSHRQQLRALRCHVLARRRHQ